MEIKKRCEFYSRNNFYYCGLVCHRSNLESPFDSVTKNKQLQQHRYIKNIPNSQWSRIVKNSENLHPVRISKNLFHLKVHPGLCQKSTQEHKYDDLRNVMQQIFFDHGHRQVNQVKFVLISRLFVLCEMDLNDAWRKSNHFREFEPQPRRCLFLKSDIKWAFSCI